MHVAIGRHVGGMTPGRLQIGEVNFAIHLVPVESGFDSE